MAKFLWVALLAVFATLAVAPATCVAADESPSASVPSATNTITPGVYKGRVEEINGSKWSDFKIDMRGDNSGTILMYKGPQGCTSPQPIKKVVAPDGEVRMESMAGVTFGCERTFYELVVTSEGFSGKMDGPTGKFRATATREKR